jgi:hypothetical protein
MSREVSPADLGESDLTVAGFQLWVHGRQFPESEDYYDGNWLLITAHCGARGARVWTKGAILLVTDIAQFANQCAAILRGDTRLAAIAPLEPELKISLEVADRLGHIRAQVEITPEYLVQAHWFEFEIDQSYLSGIIQQCSAILQEYPIRGSKYR